MVKVGDFLSATTEGVLSVKTGTTNTTVARGDHNHTGVYQPAGSYVSGTTFNTYTASTKTVLDGKATTNQIDALATRITDEGEVIAASLTDLDSRISELEDGLNSGPATSIANQIKFVKGSSMNFNDTNFDGSEEVTIPIPTKFSHLENDLGLSAGEGGSLTSVTVKAGEGLTSGGTISGTGGEVTIAHPQITASTTTGTTALTTSNNTFTVLTGVAANKSGHVSGFTKTTFSLPTDYVTTGSLNTTLSNYVASTALTNTLSGYVASTALTNTLSGYAKTGDLSGYVQTTALTNTLSGYAKTSDLSGYVASTALTNTLSGYVKTGDLSSYVQTTALTNTLSGYVASTALTNTLSGYAKTSDLSGYAKTSDLSDYAKISDLEGFVTQEEIAILEARLEDDELVQAEALVNLDERLTAIENNGVTGGGNAGSTAVEYELSGNANATGKYTIDLTGTDGSISNVVIPAATTGETGLVKVGNFLKTSAGKLSVDTGTTDATVARGDHNHSDLYLPKSGVASLHGYMQILSDEGVKNLVLNNGTGYSPCFISTSMGHLMLESDIAIAANNVIRIGAEMYTPTKPAIYVTPEGSGYTCTNLNADLLDGKHASELDGLKYSTERTAYTTRLTAVDEGSEDYTITDEQRAYNVETYTKVFNSEHCTININGALYDEVAWMGNGFETGVALFQNVGVMKNILHIQPNGDCLLFVESNSVTYEEILDAPLVDNSEGELKIADESGNTIAKFYDSGLFTTMVTSIDGFHQNSDETLKDFHEEVEVDFEKLRAIPKVYYTWKDSDKKEKQIGTSAQKVREVYPELTSINPETKKLSLDYPKLSVVALKAVDVLYEENQMLKDELNAMKEEMKLIKEKLGL
jgi:hypothetical protein